VEEPVADQPGVEEALELGIGTVELVECPAEHGVGLVEAVKVEELASEQDRGLGFSERVVDEPVCLREMLGGRLAVDECLGGAELEQQVDALGIGRRLRECATEIRDSALGGTAAGCVARRLPQRGDDLGIGRRRDE
jgi:hypothetical protein